MGKAQEKTGWVGKEVKILYEDGNQLTVMYGKIIREDEFSFTLTRDQDNRDFVIGKRYIVKMREAIR